ncbi:MAG: aminomethyl-transferring glycine dehydrogenase subunit GcvPA [Bacillota bacterium]|nr:aminomethyl-transferring glycine dehydrogenase subunit GcvPA [Bacillota bacterium]
MSGYIPHTDDDVRVMLERLGLADVADLFAAIPSELEIGEETLEAVGRGSDEIQLLKHFRAAGARNRTAAEAASFLGAGCYDHHVPAAVDQLAGRSEFLTSYTPYQAEVSQGTLQAIFEFQSQIALITGMEIANASLYDGASALAEAMLLAAAETRRQTIAVSDNLHPRYRAVLGTYARVRGLRLCTLKSDPATRQLGASALTQLTADERRDLALVILQSPNFSGVVENGIRELAAACHEGRSLLAVSWDPVASGLYRLPGDEGADIVTGEGQGIGTRPSFGGPGLGFMAARQKLLRRLPGRIVGATTDRDGRRAYVLTIQAREQHIRREKATSNICTNQALIALRSTIHLALLGPEGLGEVAGRCYHLAHLAHERLIASGAFTAENQGPFFKEFRLRAHVDTAELNRRLLAAGIQGGLRLGRLLPESPDDYLVAVTERRTPDEIDRFARIAAELAGEEGA